MTEKEKRGKPSSAFLPKGGKKKVSETLNFL